MSRYKTWNNVGKKQKFKNTNREFIHCFMHLLLNKQRQTRGFYVVAKWWLHLATASNSLVSLNISTLVALREVLLWYQTPLNHYKFLSFMCGFCSKNKSPKEVNIYHLLITACPGFYTYNYSLITLQCTSSLPSYPGKCSRGIPVKALDSGIVVSEFELQLRYYNPFRTNTLGKGMNPLSSQISLLFYEKVGFGIK